MWKSNKWAYGGVELAFPPLPAELQGQAGCLFSEATFDPDVGSEVYLVILEDDRYGRAVASTRPFRLFCTSGLVRTSQGPVIFMIWHAAQGSPNETVYEQFLNPSDIKTIRILSAAGQQSHLKVVILDNVTNTVLDWFEFENTYGFDEVVATVAKVIGHEDVGDFQLAQQEVLSRYTTEDLLDM